MRKVTCVRYALPFHTQRVTAENFQSEGYPTLEEGLSWTARSCGIASVRMVLDGVRIARGLPPCPSQGEMLRRGLALGGYKEGVGWIHRALADLAGEFGLVGEALRGRTISDLQAELDAGRPCVVSVTPRFAAGEMGEDGAILGRGGHLVAVYGYGSEDGVLTEVYLHHPSCFAPYNWPGYAAPLERFAASFSGNFITFDPTK